MKDIPIPGLCGFRLCTLTDEELLQRIAFGLQAMYSEPASVPTRNIPARPNEDFDLLVGELMIRFMYAIGEENIPYNAPTFIPDRLENSSELIKIDESYKSNLLVQDQNVANQLLEGHWFKEKNKSLDHSEKHKDPEL